MLPNREELLERVSEAVRRAEPCLETGSWRSRSAKRG